MRDAVVDRAQDRDVGVRAKALGALAVLCATDYTEEVLQVQHSSLAYDDAP